MADPVNDSSSSFSSWAPVIGAGIDAVGGIFGGFFNANQARKNRKFQERMYYQQLADNKALLEDARNYALPSAELQRIKDAGLNPLLYYGQNGASTNLTSAQPAQAPHGAQAQMSMHTNFGQAMLQSQLIQAEIRNKNADSAQKEQAAEESKSRTTGLDFTNWLNDQTAKIQVALRYRDYDYVNQMIDESRNRVYQSSFVNAHEMAALSLQNSLAIRRQNLSEYEVGQNILQGWQGVISGRISANAQMKSAIASMMHAVVAQQIAPYQIGVLRAHASLLTEQATDIRSFRNDRLIGIRQGNLLQRKQISWTDFINGENILTERQKRSLIEANTQFQFMKNDSYYTDKVMDNFNSLLNFGSSLPDSPGPTPVGRPMNNTTVTYPSYNY